MRAEEERDLLEGRSGPEYIDRILVLRAELRGRLAELVGVEAEQVALTGVDDRRVQHRARRFRPRSRRRGRDDDRRALRAHRAAAHIRRPGRRGAARSGRDRRGSDAEDAAGGAVTRALDDRAGAAGARAAGADWAADPRRRGAVGRRDPGRSGRARLPHDLGTEVALRPGVDGRARRRRPRAPPRRAAELLLAAEPTSPTGRSSPGRARGGSIPCWVPLASMSGLLAALDMRPDWAFERSAETAERCRGLLLEAGEDVVVPG